MKFIWNMIYGAIIGIANIIPGVSGGTMAVILNVYDELIEAVSTLRTQFKKNVSFLLPIGLGAGIGIILFSKIIEVLLETHPMPINFFFMGLIIGSMPLVYKRASETPIKPISVLPFIVTLALMIAMAVIGEGENTSVMTSLTVTGVLQLVIYSAIAAACMIIPGVSGSLVLMILGVYTTVLTAISSFNLPILMCVGVGVMIGILGGAKLIAYCLKNFGQMTFMAILGLMVGSLLPVFMNSGFAFSGEFIVALIALGLGAFLALLFASEKFQELVRSAQVEAPEQV